jgi:hypothetical protein
MELSHAGGAAAHDDEDDDDDQRLYGCQVYHACRETPGFSVKF